MLHVFTAFDYIKLKKPWSRQQHLLFRVLLKFTEGSLGSVVFSTVMNQVENNTLIIIDFFIVLQGIFYSNSIRL